MSAPITLFPGESWTHADGTVVTCVAPLASAMFRTMFTAQTLGQRHHFAELAGTTVGMLNQVAYAKKQIEIGLADCLVRLYPGLRLEDLPLTDRAKHQHAVRSNFSIEQAKV